MRFNGIVNVNAWRDEAALDAAAVVYIIGLCIWGHWMPRFPHSLIPTVLFSALKHIRLCTTAI